MLSENKTNKSNRNILFLAIASAATVGLLLLALPPTEASVFAWVALVPLLVALRLKPGKLGWLILWFAGFVHGTVGFIWLRHVMWFLPALLGIYLSLYFILFCAAVRRLGYGGGIPFALSAPLTWTGLEGLRSVLFTGLPWLLFAHTQYRVLPVIQIADFFGAPGVTFLLVAVNGLVADAILHFGKGRAPSRRRPALATGIAVVLVFAGSVSYGFFRLATVEVIEGPRVAVIQGNIPQSLKEQWTTESVEKMFETYLELTDEALAHDPPPDLILWPETMAPPGFFDFRRQEFLRQWLNDNPELRHTEQWLRIRGRVRRYARQIERVRPLTSKATLVISANSHPYPEDPTITYNSAFLLPQNHDVEDAVRYDKLHLVPFGEYVPLRWLFGWAVDFIVPYHYDMTPGDSPKLFEIDGWTFAPTICYEDAFPRVVANFAREHGEMDFIANLTNEAWFKDSTEMDQHLAIAVFRAIECRAGLIRAANTGISAFIDPTGRIRKRLVVDGRDREVAGVLHGVATKTEQVSPYLTVGEWFGAICTAAWFLCLIGVFYSSIAKGARRTAKNPAMNAS